MLEVFTRMLGFALMNCLGIYIIKVITNRDIKIFTIKSIILVVLSIITQYFLYEIEYSTTYTLMIFIMNVFVYKAIFNEKYITLIIGNLIITILMFLIDIAMSLVLMNFLDINNIRENNYLFLLISTIAFFILVIIIRTKNIKRSLINFIDLLSKEKYKNRVIYYIASTLVLFFVIYNLSNNFRFSKNNLINIILVVIYTTLIILIIKDKNDHRTLLDEYDNLFKYIQNFEEWIERDQLNRHEYKNQLAVLRLMTNETKLKAKIDEILDDTVDINNEIINELSTLPTGGIKGLMYYKAAVAQKEKINLTVNVSLQENSCLEKFTSEQIKDVNKLIGIYFDNAIEAAKETKDKVVLVEIYEFPGKAKFVISNTFNNKLNIEHRNEKGKSSKGEGRGNGLYFASKIINKYQNIEQVQEVIDDYYIQSVIYKKTEV